MSWDGDASPMVKSRTAPVSRVAFASFSASFSTDPQPNPSFANHRVSAKSYFSEGDFDPPPGTRHVAMHCLDMDRRRSNKIRTNKYYWYSIVPVMLWEQFSQAANAYFLIVSCLQMIPLISNTNGLPLTAVPLSFVVCVSAMKDLYEDFRRCKSDAVENNRKSTIIDSGGNEQLTTWERIRPGVVLRVLKGEQIPTDALLLKSSTDTGDCYVQTMNLDGETNLKKKTAALTEWEWKEVQPGGLHAGELSLECEAPSVDLYRFLGAAVTPSSSAKGVGIGSLLLRGTMLEQTDWVLCLAVYCGHDTRAMMNAQSARYKMSKMDSELQKVVYLLFSVQISVCFVTAVAGGIWNGTYGDSTWYLDEALDHNMARVVAAGMGTWLLLTCNTVPISLIVTLTCVKFIQSLFITYDDAFGSRKAEVHTSQVIESLGQVSHVFSDKTGTLTMNVMEYKGCSVAGRIYGLCDDGKDLDPTSDSAILKYPHVNFNPISFNADLAAVVETGVGHLSGRPAQLATFLLAHALCHTVEVAIDSGGDDSFPNYNASSPDELALVSMATAMGLEFLRVLHGRSHLRVKGAALGAALGAACGWRRGASSALAAADELEIELLDVCEFDNERKRMSVVVRYPDGRIFAFIKGADSMVLEFCHQDSVTGSNVNEHLWSFASRGLRTLAHATRQLSEDEYREWHSRYVDAQKMLSEERMVVVQKLAIELETKPCDLLGVTAIEDCLQDEVPETIQQLRAAGIRVWVLTGDKVETAISIALSCKLITEEMTNVVVDGSSAEEVVEKFAETGTGDWPALTIAGGSLAIALDTEELKKRLFEVAEQCCVVICCRVSPKQKADVVELVKLFEPSAVTLSIGDGANDVSMIVAAHVGVGIAGKEGAQAAGTADFALSEFRLLRRLLFVHGRESYRRMAVLALYNFYKNILLALPTALTGYAAAFTGQNIFHPWPVQLHNILYSHVAVCLYGIFDRAAVDFQILENDASDWGTRKFSRSAVFVWVIMAVIQATLYTEIAVRVLGGSTSDGGMPMDDIYSLGTIRFAWIVIGVNITMVNRHVTWFHWMVLPYAFNILSIVITLVVTDSPHGTFSRGVMTTTFDYNVLRVFAASLLAMSAHAMIGELFIRWDIELAEAISRCSRRLIDFTGYKTDSTKVPPLRAQITGRQIATSSMLRKQVATNASATRSAARSAGVASQFEEGDSFSFLPDMLRPASSSFDRPRSGLAPASTGNTGYAYSEECCLERSRDKTNLFEQDVAVYKKNLMRNHGRRHSFASATSSTWEPLDGVKRLNFGGSRERSKSLPTSTLPAEIELPSWSTNATLGSTS